MAVQPTPAALTHVWLEAPLFPATLAMLPASVTVVDAAPAAVDPFSGAGPAQVIIASSRLRYDGAAMDALPNLRMIARTGIGVDNIDLAAATAHGIVVTNTPDGPTESTAEHTVAMLLALAKRLKQGNANLAEGNWGPRTGVLVGTEVWARRWGSWAWTHWAARGADLPAFDMNAGLRPASSPQSKAASFDVTLTDLDDVIARADFLSLHVPATPETTGMINAARIA
ncbi:MAG: NAD(P)-dependent oxidoreductase [Caldilineaceae bacterium]